jgi:hypothetical protein
MSLPDLDRLSAFRLTDHYYSGCYVGRSPNLGPDAGIWSLYSATAQVLPGGSVGAHLLTTACGD